MRIRSTAGVVAVVAASGAMLLAACAPGQVEGGSSDTGGSDPTEVESVDPSEFAGKTLNYVYFTDGPDEAATRELITAFEETYDVTVNLEILPYADLVTSVTQRLTGGNAPDVARLSTLQDFRADLLPLGQYLGADYRDEFLEGPLQAVVEDDGDIIAVPSDQTLNGLFVNVDLFDQAGVELPDPEDPWTWEEMLDAASKVKAATGTAYAFAMDKSGHRLSTVLSQYGTALLSADGVALDEAKAVAAMQPLVDMMAVDDMPRDFWLGSGSRYEGANEIFLAGETPIYLSGTWNVGLIDENAEFEWAVAPNACEAECGGFPGGKYMAAFRESKNPALAAEFIRFMNETGNQEIFLQAAGSLPTRVDLQESGVTYPESRQAAMDVFNLDLGRTPTFGYESNASPAFSGSATELVNQISEVVAGNKDLPTAMADLRTSTQSILDEVTSW
ncbi:carbohydrate ABC transporter substrate-binding protein (CUT1 family) [Salana multivorans]|uniref:Carbohydrate ABC transporter substrate-binding protein (CUT1 family) n=1 Tax=Salana multivorans TaxID=120377 RepID=A0A3N2DB20_9MICO|nr:sugar ABC transporter substrate-binding protein [Salana multivorans]ROR97005.1 carbohydrate ABC transporter substrate-binding protein (CUT1 family) [Salana multivorans]